MRRQHKHPHLCTGKQHAGHRQAGGAKFFFDPQNMIVIRSARENWRDTDHVAASTISEQHDAGPEDRAGRGQRQAVPDALHHALAERDVDDQQDRAAVHDLQVALCFERPTRRSTAAPAVRAGTVRVSCGATSTSARPEQAA